MANPRAELFCKPLPIPPPQTALQRGMSFRPFLNRAGIKSAERIIPALAEDIRGRLAAGQCVTQHDLELLGWLPDQLAKHGADASRRAHQLLEA